ncbi:hypothetical protein DSM104443_03092 [Usitatibacter rugosus]|uniref:Uncharacterized protein n=1 Tax=Usitatibacter rugosus TaxID=2732067 RepID=A0A6M4GXI7_9PROT|nr:hypothetical protein [Usitatibacter rugosus]QJR12009.1 hypothetical protein DSM104443_03092 [Usitatibacter rugosus]
MFIWKGNGHWAALLVALIIVGAGKALGPIGTSAGLAVSGVLMFLLHGAFGEDASAFYFPVKYWPCLLLPLAVLTFFSR